MSTLCRLLPVAALVVSVPAFAASADEAEHIRLSEETRKLAARNAWRGVEAAYLKMEELEKRGVVLTVDDYLLGVQAARQLGNVLDVYNRLKKADGVAPSDELKGQIAAIEGSFGVVDLDVDDKFKGTFELKPAAMPFDPGQRKAIEVAQKQLAETRKFKGMLPFGQYTIGERSFTVQKDVAIVDVYLGVKKGGKDDGKVASRERAGLRLDVGPQFSSMGGGDVSLAEGGPSITVQSAATGTVGGRLGVGYELYLAKGWSLLLEGGWHGGFAGKLPGQTDPAAGPVISESKQGLQSVYGWVGPTWYKDDLAITFGPTYSYASVKTSVDAEGMGALTGHVTTGGAALSVFYGLFDTPGIANSRSGFSLAGGVFASKTMTFPWAQVAFTIAPEG